MFFRKKIKEPISISLEEKQFCTSWFGKQKDCAYSFEIETSGKYYNLIYRDGEFLGMPLPNGGTIYPFSHNVTKKGSRRAKKQYKNIEVICITSGASLNIDWGTPDFLVYDETGKPYTIGANGTFYVEIDPADAAGSADKFYKKLCSHGAEMTTESLRNKLKAAFEKRIGAEIEDVLAEMNRPFSSFVGITSKEAIKISEAVYYKVKDVFSDFGITIEKTASMGSIVNSLVVREFNK